MTTSSTLPARIALDTLDITQPFRIPADVLLKSPSINGVRQIVLDLRDQCQARGLVLSEWIDGPTNEHVFRVEPEKTLTVAKLNSLRSLFQGHSHLSH